MLSMLKIFESQNNLVPLFLLTKITKVKHNHLKESNYGIVSIKNRDMGEILDSIDLDIDTIKEGMKDLQKACLIRKDKHGDFQFDEVLNVAIYAIDRPDERLESLIYTITINNKLEQYGISDRNLRQR